MDPHIKVCCLLALAILLVFPLFTNGMDFPMDLDETFGKLIEENFMKHISDDLMTKLKKKSDEAGNIDLDNLENADLTDEEKKQVENALKEALTPLFGQFVQMMTQSGIPGEMTKFKEVESSDDINKVKTPQTNKELPEKSKEESCTEKDSQNKDSKCEAKDEKAKAETEDERVKAETEDEKAKAETKEEL